LLGTFFRAVFFFATFFRAVFFVAIFFRAVFFRAVFFRAARRAAGRVRTVFLRAVVFFVRVALRFFFLAAIDRFSLGVWVGWQLVDCH